MVLALVLNINKDAEYTAFVPRSQVLCGFVAIGGGFLVDLIDWEARVQHNLQNSG
jgi:hypothetical protein